MDRAGGAATAERRRLLATRANPAAGQDCLVRYAALIDLGPDSGCAALELSFVPDRVVLEARTLDAYRTFLSGLGAASVEDLGVVVLGDMASELVPKWLRVAVTMVGPDGRPAGQQAILEESQPGWTAKDMRLPPVPPINPV